MTSRESWQRREVRPGPLTANREGGGKARGEKNCRLYQVAGARGIGPSVAPDWSRAWPARPEHHGILQDVQRQDPGSGKRHADSGDHHRVLGQVLRLRDEDASGVLLPEESGEGRWWLQNAGP